MANKQISRHDYTLNSTMSSGNSKAKSKRYKVNAVSDERNLKHYISLWPRAGMTHCDSEVLERDKALNWKIDKEREHCRVLYRLG